MDAPEIEKLKAPRIRTWQERLPAPQAHFYVREEHIAMQAEIADLRAEVERLRADAERFQKAIMFEDNAEALYAAVLNHAPDGAAIRAEFDAAIEKEKA